MSRYHPTPDEVARLAAEGWRVDSEGWWWPVGEYGYGRTYREARRESIRRKKKDKADD